MFILGEVFQQIAMQTDFLPTFQQQQITILTDLEKRKLTEK